MADGTGAERRHETGVQEGAQSGMLYAMSRALVRGKKEARAKQQQRTCAAHTGPQRTRLDGKKSKRKKGFGTTSEANANHSSACSMGGQRRWCPVGAEGTREGFQDIGMLLLLRTSQKGQAKGKSVALYMLLLHAYVRTGPDGGLPWLLSVSAALPCALVGFPRLPGFEGECYAEPLCDHPLSLNHSLAHCPPPTAHLVVGGRRRRWRERTGVPRAKEREPNATARQMMGAQQTQTYGSPINPSSPAARKRAVHDRCDGQDRLRKRVVHLATQPTDLTVGPSLRKSREAKIRLMTACYHHHYYYRNHYLLRRR
ncbi:hypothetical protein IWX50DRAFT_219011 [Phyllosticta citricarpa]